MAKFQGYEHKSSLEHIANMSFDPDFEISAVELMGFDPLSGTNGALKRVTTNAMGEYQMNDKVDVGDITYIGLEDAAGEWIVQKLDNTSGISRRFATKKNNPTVTSYNDAWTNRLTLTYDTFSIACS